MDMSSLCFQTEKLRFNHDSNFVNHTVLLPVGSSDRCGNMTWSYLRRLGFVVICVGLIQSPEWAPCSSSPSALLSTTSYGNTNTEGSMLHSLMASCQMCIRLGRLIRKTLHLRNIQRRDDESCLNFSAVRLQLGCIFYSKDAGDTQSWDTADSLAGGRLNTVGAFPTV